MQRCDKSIRVCVLGGTSQVWRQVAPFWRTATEGVVETIVCARRTAPQIDVVGEAETIIAEVKTADIVLAMWGVTGGDTKALAVNSVLAEQSQQIGAALGATCVIHMSSGAVYAPSDGPINEEALIDPRHPYGRSKHDAEQAAGAFGPPAIFLRLGNVAGCDGLAAALRTRDCIDLDVFSDGTSPRRSYLAPDDLAHALADLCRMACVPERFAPGLCLNVAGSHPVAMDALLRAAQRPFRLQDAPQGALPLQHLDVCRLKDLGISLPQSADPAHLAKFLPPLAVASSLGTPEQRGTA